MYQLNHWCTAGIAHPGLAYRCSLAGWPYFVACCLYCSVATYLAYWQIDHHESLYLHFRWHLCWYRHCLIMGLPGRRYVCFVLSPSMTMTTSEPLIAQDESWLQWRSGAALGARYLLVTTAAITTGRAHLRQLRECRSGSGICLSRTKWRSRSQLPPGISEWTARNELCSFDLFLHCTWQKSK